MEFGIYTYQFNDLVSSIRTTVNEMFGYDEAYKAFDELSRAYMLYLDNKTIETYDAFLMAIYNMDEYCIYLREIVHKILEMITELHPRYTQSYLTHFVNYFHKFTRVPH